MFYYESNSMALLNYLKNNFPADTPIFVNEVKPDDMSYEAIRQELCRLFEANKIAKFSNGVYYFPIETIMGPSLLSPDQVIQKKYVTDGKRIYGFVSGEDFLNDLRVSFQIATFRTVTTNAMSGQDRYVQIGKSVAYIKKCPVEVNNSNWKILQFLQMVNDTEPGLLIKKRDIIAKYARTQRFSLDEALGFLCKYPDKTLKKFVETGVYHAFAK